MRVAAMAVTVVSLAACSEAGGEQVRYRASWTCVEPSGQCVPAPIGEATTATITTGDGVAVDWESGSRVIATHVGVVDAVGCVSIPDGSDMGVDRSWYTLCANGDLLWGTPAWESAWLVELSPL